MRFFTFLSANAATGSRSLVVVLVALGVGIAAFSLNGNTVTTATGSGSAEGPFVRLQTEAGDILLVLYPDLAPHHVDHFVRLSRSGFYDGTYFHRVVPGFVIQGGDPNSKDRDPRNDGQGGPTYRDVLSEEELLIVEELNTMLGEKGYAGISENVNVKAEFSASAKHLRGTLSMARARPPDSAGSQFFICVAATSQLDGQYTIFGHVVTGMDVVDRIVAAQVDPARGREAPAKPIYINAVTVVEKLVELTAEEQQAFRDLQAEPGGGAAPE